MNKSLRRRARPLIWAQQRHFGLSGTLHIDRPPSDFGTDSRSETGRRALAAAPRTFAAPLIVLATAVVLAVAHVLFYLLPQATAAILEWRMSLSPLALRQGLAQGRIGALSPLATHVLLHANFVHLFFNVVWLLPFGSAVARRLGAADYAWGSARSVVLFLTLFVLSGVTGGVLFVLLNLNSPTPAVGASGAVFGLLGALMRFWTGRDMPRGVSTAPIVPLSHPFLIRMTLANLGLNLLLAFAGPLLGFPKIAWEAHVGGYLFGLLAFPAFARAAARN